MKAKEIKQRFREWRTVRTRKNLNRVVPFWKTFWILFGCLFLLPACTGIWSLVSEYRNTFPALEEEYQDDINIFKFDVLQGMHNREAEFSSGLKNVPTNLKQCIVDSVSLSILNMQSKPNLWWGLYDIGNQQMVLEKNEGDYFVNLYYREAGNEADALSLFTEVSYQLDKRQDYIAKELLWRSSVRINSVLLKGNQIIILSYCYGGEEEQVFNADDFPEIDCSFSSEGERIYGIDGYRLVQFEERDEQDDWLFGALYGMDLETEVIVPMNYTFATLDENPTKRDIQDTALKNLNELLKKTGQSCEESKILYHTERNGLFHKRHSATFYFSDYVDGKSYVCYILYDFREEEDQFIKSCEQTILLIMLIPMIISFLVAFILHRRSKMNHAVYTYRSTLNNAMAHDLKTPLMAISGYAENVVEGTNPGKRDYYVSEMSKQVSYMKNMIEGIQSLANSEDGNEEKSVRIDLKSLTEEVLQGLQSEITEGKYAFSISGDCNLKSMRTSMETLVRNLIENACKYAPEGDAVAIKLERKTFTISNSLVKQITVKPDKLLEPFTKGDTSRSGRKGTGLGLAIVKSICDRYGYRVGINTDDGRFTVRIHF